MSRFDLGYDAGGCSCNATYAMTMTTATERVNDHKSSWVQECRPIDDIGT